MHSPPDIHFQRPLEVLQVKRYRGNPAEQDVVVAAAHVLETLLYRGQDLFERHDLVGPGGKILDPPEILPIRLHRPPRSRERTGRVPPVSRVHHHQLGRIDSLHYIINGIHLKVHVGVLPVGEADETREGNDVAGPEGFDVLHELAHHAIARLLFSTDVVSVPGPAGDGELVKQDVDGTQVARHGAHGGDGEVAIVYIEHHLALRPHCEAGIQVPDLATVDLHFGGDGDEPRPGKFNDVLESEGSKDLYDFV